MKTFQILFCMTAFLLSACHAKVDNTFNESSLNHELDSITQVILSENMQAQFAKADYTPKDKDVDRCVEICDTLIAHGVVPQFSRICNLAEKKTGIRPRARNFRQGW